MDLKKRKTEPILPLGADNISGFLLSGQLFIQKKDDPVLYRLEKGKDQLSPTDFIFSTPKSKLFWESGMSYPILIDGSSAWVLKPFGKSFVAELICSEIPNLGLIKFIQYSEKKGLLFLGTASRGFGVIRTNKVSQVRKANFSPQDPGAYYSQWEWAPGNILTNEGHLLGQQGISKAPLSGKFGFAMYEDGDSLFWFSSGRPKSTGSVLFQLDRKTGKKKQFDKIDIFNVFAFARWNDRILIGNHRGLGVLEGESQKIIFKNNPSISGDPISYNLMELEPGIFGMTTCAGWVRFDLNKGISDTLLNLPGYCVRAQYKIGEYILIGTYGKGFYLYHRGVLKQMPLDKYEFLLYTHCFVSDNNGFIWMSTNRGLFKAAWSDLQRAFHQGDEVYYHYYGRNDGMEMTELNGGCSPCGLRMKNGTLSFPSMDGLVWIDPNKNNDVFPDGPIQIDEVLIDGKSVDGLENARTKPNDEILIRLGYSAWSNNENVYIDYQLDKGAWTRITEDRGSFIRLTNISSGNHQLLIRKRNGFGQGNFSYQTLAFTVDLAWYEKWWVYALFISGLILIIDLVSRFRNRRLLARQALLESMVNEKTQVLKEQNEILEKNNSIKTRLISIISHDIVTPLKFLTVAGKSLKENRKKISEEVQQETIADITQTAQELQLLSTNILNWIKYQNENRLLLPDNIAPHTLVEQVFSLLSSLGKEKNIQLVNSIDPSWKIDQFAEPLKILIYNLVSNSIRYSDAGVIEVGANIKSAEESTLWVADMGVGMKQETIDHLLKEDILVHNLSNESRSGHGLGYLIIKDLVRWLGARIDIQSTPGKGTRVSIFIRPRSK
jgi:signal transduction histidine kinase